MKKHKWHDEIVAWASGAEIETKVSGWSEWTDVTSPNPCWYDENEYRIKPQPKEPQYMYAYEAGGEYRFSWCKSAQMPFQLGDRMIRMNYKGKIKLEDE